MRIIRNPKNNPYWIVITVFLLIFLMVGVLCLQYYKGLQSTIKNESHEYLQEISRQIAGNASRNIQDNFAVLGTISSVLKSSGVKTYEALQPEVLAQQTFWNYKDILLIDGNGNAYDAHGNVVLLSGDEYLREAVVNRRRAMSPSQVINGTECIVFVIPLNGLVINGTPMYALAATYDLATFDHIISVNVFSGRGYVHIIQKDGAMVIRSSSQYAPQTGYNLLSSLSSVMMEDGMSLPQIKADMGMGNSGVVAYSDKEGRRVYMAYTPLGNSEWYLMGFVPVEVVNAKSELLMRTTLLLCAAITLAFAMLVAYQMLTYSRHKHKLEQIAYVDPITGGNTIERFYELATELIKAAGKTQYSLVYLNVEKFKLLNEEFGRQTCDEMLRCLHDGITSDLSPHECMGRLFADNFCILAVYANEEQTLKRFEAWYEAAGRLQDAKSVWLSPIVEFGVYVINNDSLPFPHMIDRAKLALKETSTELRGRLRYAVYDDAIRRQLFREKHLENIMGAALQNREFQVYLQPKYRTESETIGGAEALVRWMSAEGMIYPDEFISLFEKNGFIIQLDLWVFEEVCLRIRAWLDAGLTPVKVSVNCSRVQLKNPLFLERYIEICQRCGTPPQYIEIELTENVVFEDVGKLSKIIDAIHAAGFGCAMDDFGSGYSSLNLIQNIPVDTIKLDKVFFRNGALDIKRTESVVGSILAMSRSLDMTTVAEGVEERVQVDMLKRLGCDYIQGYYFAKPMPIPDFERLAFGAALKDDPEETKLS